MTQAFNQPSREEVSAMSSPPMAEISPARKYANPVMACSKMLGANAPHAAPDIAPAASKEPIASERPPNAAPAKPSNNAKRLPAAMPNSAQAPLKTKLDDHQPPASLTLSSIRHLWDSPRKGRLSRLSIPSHSFVLRIVVARHKQAQQKPKQAPQ